MDKYNDKSLINIGTGTDISIQDLSTIIAEVIKYKGEII
jgi:GDP-L-fucose synthase